MKLDYMETKLKEFEQEFLDIEDENYAKLYLSEARQILSDIDLIEQLIPIMKKSNKFSFEVLPSQQGTIRDWFVKKLFFNYSSQYWRSENKMVRLLKIYDITIKVFAKISFNKNLEQKKYPDKKWIWIAIEWGKVVKYFTDIDIKEEITCFHVCGEYCKKIRRAWDKLEKLKTEIGKVGVS